MTVSSIILEEKKESEGQPIEMVLKCVCVFVCVCERERERERERTMQYWFVNVHKKLHPKWRKV